MNFRYWRLRGFTISNVNILSDGVHLNSHGLAKSVAFCYYTTEVYADCIAMMSGVSGYLFYFVCAFSFILFCINLYFVFSAHIAYMCSCFSSVFYIMTPLFVFSSFSSHLSIFTVTIFWFWNRYTC